MPPLHTFWAKMSAGDTRFHPLISHLIDVGAVARRLCGQRDISPLRVALGLLPEQDAWLHFVIAAHDIGKATPPFQGHPSLSDEQREAVVRALPGFSLHCADRNCRHERLSVRILSRWLEAKGVARLWARAAAKAVGGHHGVFHSDPEGNDVYGDKDSWGVAQTALLDELAAALQVPLEKPPTAKDIRDQSQLMILAGLTTLADWLGSNDEDFPFADQTLSTCSIADYAINSDSIATKVANRLHFRPPEKASALLLFATLFGFEPRPLQAAMEIAVRGRESPCLYLVEAPMGEGKTEAAMYAIDAANRRTGAGAYFALPTMATSNGLFERFAKFIRDTRPGSELHLLHGQASMSDDYDKLKRAAYWVYEQDRKPFSAVADAWFAGNKKRALLAPFGVGTIDQALISVLQTKHFFLRLFGLAGKTVVLDEVHAYDAYMSTLLELLLKWLGAMNCNVVLLSATLPSGKRRSLLEAFAGGPVSAEWGAYPRLTQVGADKTQVVVTPFTASATKVIELRTLQEARLADTLRTLLADRGFACVIRNTVGLAQKTFADLKAALPDLDIRLFHARFPFGRRNDIEKEVLTTFGKDGPRQKKVILVATQVVEQSLDLDFDVMVTDIAPIDLMLQRSGRMHRHENLRPTACRVPQLFWLSPESDGSTTSFGVSEKIYSKYFLLRTLQCLQRYQTLTLPNNIEDLIEEVYREDPADAEQQAAWLKMDDERRGQEDKATGFLIFEPRTRKDFWDDRNLQLSEDDDPRTHGSRRAATRDIEPSVSLVFAYDIDGNLWLDAQMQHPFPLHEKPTKDEMKEILRNAVTVTNYRCVEHYADIEPPKEWRKTGMLKYHRLVRLDQDGVRQDESFGMQLDRELGVLFTRMES